MAYANTVFSGRYQWDDTDKDFDWISGQASMYVEKLFDLETPLVLGDPGRLSSAVKYLRRGYHRSGGHQLWVVLTGTLDYTYVCYIGVNGNGERADDAATLKYWLTQNLVLEQLLALWPTGWDVDPDAVIEPPVVVPVPVSPLVEEADFGHLRTQFRRQSIFRRR